MSDTVLDLKIKSLIQVCKETRNNKKLSVVSFILTSNKLDEIGIKLGIRKRNKKSGEKIFEYMTLINDIFDQNLKIRIIAKELIEVVKKCELLFLRNKGVIPYDCIKSMYHVYYEMRKLEVPNLHNSLIKDVFLESSQLGFFSYLSPHIKRKQNEQNILKPLIIQKIKEKELFIKRELEHSFNSQLFEDAIQLHSVKNSLTKRRKNKIIVQGSLKQDLSYQKSIEDIFKYLVLGLIILLFLLGSIILIEVMYLPTEISGLSSWSFFFLGPAAILILIYIRFFKREGVLNG